MTIPKVLLERSAFKVPLTLAHYAAIKWRRYRLSRRFPAKKDTDARVEKVVAELRQHGWALLTNYISAADCAGMREDIDLTIAAGVPNLQREYDGAEHRYFGAEAFSAKIKDFHEDRFLRDVAEYYIETQAVNIATLAGKSLPAKTRSHHTGRWHRDSFGRQIKALAYLSDVTVDSGPFEFIAGSHRLSRILYDLRAGGLRLLQWRLSDEDVERVRLQGGIETQKVVASLGTVILVDTSCIHRAMPITDGVRYAITNYYVERGRYRPEIAAALKVPYRSEDAPTSKGAGRSVS